MDIVQAFASPSNQEGFDISSVVAQKHLERVRRRVLLSLPENAQDSLARNVEVASVRPEVAWRPEIGMAHTACDVGQGVLAALQLIVMQSPAEFECTGTVDSGSIFLDGWLIPVEGEIAVSASHGTLEIRSAGRVANFVVNDQSWKLQSKVRNPNWTVHPTLVSRPRYIIDSGIAGSSRMFPRIGGKGLHAFTQDSEASNIGPHTIEVINSAFQGIAKSGDYGSWMASGVDGVILTAGEVSVGLSSPKFPGLIALNLQGSVLDYAETIISAVCHQKLFQLAMLYAFTDPGIEEIHYIPERRSYTTTRRALAAAHEHVNAIRMLEGFSHTSVAPDLIATRIRKRSLMLATDCLSPLEKSTILTPAGTSLWAQLQRHLSRCDTKQQSANRPSEWKQGEAALSCAPSQESAKPQILVAG